MLDRIIIPLVFLVVGFSSAYLIFSDHALPTAPDQSGIDDKEKRSGERPLPAFTSLTDLTDTSDSGRIERLENELQSLKEHVATLEHTIAAQTADHGRPIPAPAALPRRKSFSSALTRRLYSLESLERGGIEASRAEDIVRRKNAIELQRLALQDRATREGYLNTQQYYDELTSINQQDVSLREELGDDGYDAYLFNSKQNNRIRIASVMLGSEAERAGIKKGDIVLSYNDRRMFTWQELKDATTEGELGEYVSISIYRNGEIFSFSIPRGPLGMQLGATRLEP